MANKIQFEIGMDGSGFVRGINQLTSVGINSLKNFVSGAVGVYSLEQAFHKTIETADELVTTSKRLDLSVEQLQILRQAAKDNNVEFSALAANFEKLDIARANALGGGRDAAKYLKAFEQLGITQSQLLNDNAATIFTGTLAGTIKNTNPEQIAGPLRDIFGRGFGQFVPVLKTDFDELGSKMKNVGALMDANVAAKLAAVGDEFSLLSQIVTSQLGPALLAFAEWAYSIILKGGGKAAAAGAFYGVVSQKIEQETPETAPKEVLSSKPGLDGKPRINFWKELWYQIFKNNSDALNAASDAQKPWQDSIKQFQTRLAELQRQANNPPKPNFSAEVGAEAPETKSKNETFRLGSSDSLVRTGNFLGSAKGKIESLQQQANQIAREHLSVSRKIEINTRTKARPPGEYHYPIH